MPRHRRSLTRLETAAAAALTFAVAGCTSGSDAVPVPGADEVITAPVASIDDVTAPVVTEAPLPDETPTSAPPEPVATEPTPDSAPTTAATTTPATTTTSTTVTPAETSPVPVTGAPAGDVFLRRGDEGDAVGLMQFKLSVLEYLPTGSDNGVFDEATESGLRRFQSDYGLGVDGVFGAITERSLNAALQSIEVET